MSEILDEVDVKSLGQRLQKVHQGIEELTHEKAREVLAMPHFVGERPKRAPHISNLASHMRRGTFMWDFANITVCRCNEEHNGHPKGTVFRVNGQHTCEARLLVPPKMRAPIPLYRYTASTENDLRLLYASIDRGTPRTKGNVIDAYLAGNPDFDQYPVHVRKIIHTGLAMWLWPEHSERSRHDGDDLACRLLTTDRDITQKVSAFLADYGPKQYPHISRRGPVVAAMFETFHKSPRAAATFWDGVATGLNIDSERDPRKKLRDRLMTLNVGSGGGSRADVQTLPPEPMYRLCIQHWNAWRRGETPKFYKIPSERIPAQK